MTSAPEPMPHRILAIEDDPALLERVQECLNPRGFSVTSADYDRAGELIDQVQPELVIIDSPGGHQRQGWRVLDILKHDDAAQATPVIIYSDSAVAQGLASDAAVLREFAVLVLPRPVNVDDLPRQVTQLLHPPV